MRTHSFPLLSPRAGEGPGGGSWPTGHRSCSGFLAKQRRRRCLGSTAAPRWLGLIAFAVAPVRLCCYSRLCAPTFAEGWGRESRCAQRSCHSCELQGTTMKSSSPVLFALAFVCLSACAPPGGAAGPQPAVGSEFRRILVDNRTPNTLRVYLLGAGGETFLGRVQPLTEAQLRFPEAAAGTIQLVARPSVDMGMNQRHVSTPIQSSAGHTIAWHLHASPGSTSLPRVSTVRVLDCRGRRSC